MVKNLIFEYRKSLKVNQKEFAKIINQSLPGFKIQKTNIDCWENGKYLPYSPVLKLLADKMDKSEQDIKNNLVRCLKPSKYTLEGQLKSNLNKTIA